MTSGRHPLYQAALDADSAFQRALVRVYGAKRAGDMRYQTSRWTDRNLKAVAIRKMRADDKWLRHMRSSRTSNPLRRRGPNPRGKVPPHLRRYLFKKGHR